MCGERKFAATRELNQNVTANGGMPSGGEVLFAVKTMFLPYKKDSDTYDNTKLLCGERKFAATRELTQNVTAMVACPVAAKFSSPLK